MAEQTIKRGVYFMANNKVLEMTIAFLNSFRVHNEDLPLCLIPYDNDFCQIDALKNIYDFGVFSNQKLLETCDNISEKFHGNTVGAYRKLVAWEGNFEQFIYIDIDTVVLENLSFVWQNLSHCKLFTSHSNISDIRKFVWKDSIYDKNTLTRTQIDYSANTGFFVSSKKTLPMIWILDQVNLALQLKNDMELLCMEQPFLNFLFVTSGYNYGSLVMFSEWENTRDLKFELWAGTPGAKVIDGRLFMPNTKSIFLVHWAGVWQSNNGSLEDIPYKKLWDYYRNLNPLNLPIQDDKSKNYFTSKIIKYYNDAILNIKTHM